MVEIGGGGGGALLIDLHPHINNNTVSIDHRDCEIRFIMGSRCNVEIILSLSCFFMSRVFAVDLYERSTIQYWVYITANACHSSSA